MTLEGGGAVGMWENGYRTRITETCREYTAEEGDTSIPQARQMTRDADFDIVSHPGGQFSSNELATVNIRSGHHIVLLKVKYQSGEVDQHAMALTERGGEMHLNTMNCDPYLLDLIVILHKSSRIL